MKQFTRFLLVVGLYSLATLRLLSQSTDATISGVVTDHTGKVIPAADIEILEEATGIHYPSKTNGSGTYTVSILRLGTIGCKDKRRRGSTLASMPSGRADSPPT